MRRRIVVIVLGLVVAGTLVVGIPVALRRPSNAGSWRPEQARLPHIRLSGDSVWIGNVRDYRWAADSSVVAGWEDAAYDLRTVRRVYFVLSPFARAWRGPAHTFLSFGFDDGRYLAVSVEARKQVGQDYSPLRGALRSYELMVVLGEERDLVGMRALQWRDPVYVYPARATPAQARLLFLRMLQRAKGLESHPEFYNTLTSNCTTNLVDAVNAIWPQRIRATWQTLLPGYSDALAYRLGILDTTLPLDSARARFQVNDRARAAAPEPDAIEFSRRIHAVEATGPLQGR